LIKTEKKEKLSTLKSQIESSKSFVLIDFTGVNVELINMLRRDAKKSNIKYNVVKNTLLRKAVENTQFDCIKQFLTGPTAIAISDEDPVKPAKLILDFFKKNRVLAIKGGALSHNVLSVKDVTKLAELPSKDELISKALYVISSPIIRFVTVLGNPIRNFITDLKLLEKQKLM
jgi:large subunit ribosomal protein L10